MIGRRWIAGTAVVAAVAAGGMAGALIGIPGISGASTGSSSSTSTTTTPNGSQPKDATHAWGRGRFGGAFIGADKDVLAAGAKALHLSTEDLLAKLSDGKTTIADVAKEQGVPVQDVIDAMAAVAKSDITDLVNNPLPVPPSFSGMPDLKGGPGFGFGHFGGGLCENKIDSAAKALGITTDELMQDLRDGKSIADVAKAKGISVDTVIAAIVKDAQTKIDAAVKDKHLTQDQADKLTKDLKDRVTNLVNNTGPKDLGRFGPYVHGFGPGGGMGFGPGAGDPSTQAG
jgi:hypothetical protein